MKKLSIYFTEDCVAHRVMVKLPETRTALQQNQVNVNTSAADRHAGTCVESDATLETLKT